VDLVVQRANVDVDAVCAPADGCDGGFEVESDDGLLPSVFSSFPDLDCAVVGAGGDELGAAAAGHGAVDGVDDFAVGADFAEALAGCEVYCCEEVVCGDGVEGWGAERPLEVEDGGFCEVGDEAVVGVWRVGAP